MTLNEIIDQAIRDIKNHIAIYSIDESRIRRVLHDMEQLSHNLIVTANHYSKKDPVQDIPEDVRAAGFTQHISARTASHFVNDLLVKPGTDVDAVFKAWSINEKKFVKMDGYRLLCKPVLPTRSMDVPTTTKDPQPQLIPTPPAPYKYLIGQRVIVFDSEIATIAQPVDTVSKRVCIRSQGGSKIECSLDEIRPLPNGAL